MYALPVVVGGPSSGPTADEAVQAPGSQPQSSRDITPRYPPSLTSSCPLILTIYPQSIEYQSVNTLPDLSLSPKLAHLCPLCVLVPVASLPTELLGEIAGLAAECPEVDFIQADWTEGVDYTTLKALCLTSRSFNALATPHLYRHLILPSAEAAHALIATLDSAEWQASERGGKAGGLAKEITFGRRVASGGQADGEFVGEVLAALGGARVERVAVVGLEVDAGALAGLIGECSTTGLPSLSEP